MIPDPLAEVLMHALGLDERRREPWRNHCVTGADDPDVAQLVALGFMQPTIRPGFIPATDRVYHVTDAGRVEAIAANDRINPPPKRRRSVT